jgi:hypothetical protein
VDFRKRIHVGRLVHEERSGSPTVRPDANPEEARAARDDVRIAVRDILHWLERNP